MKDEAYIFLDDHRNPGEVTWCELPTLPPGKTWEIVRSYEDFIALLTGMSPETIVHVSFDHDLGYGHGLPDHEAPNGYHCAKALVDWCMDEGKPLPTFTIHSMNPVGAENIRAYLENYRKVSNG